MTYVADAPAFRMPERGSTSSAFFRIDDGQPRLVRDEMPELARLRVATDRVVSSRLTQVYLPAAQFGAARAVWISPKFGARPKRFSLEGFSALLDLAHANGCSGGGWRSR